MTDHARPDDLAAAVPRGSRNDALVLATLEAAEAPLSAYEILDRLRERGLRAPPQVYRALERLLAGGRVHRLESLNAYVACQHAHARRMEATAFIICEGCARAEEVTDGPLGRRLNRLAADNAFELHGAAVELRGLCARCAAEAAAKAESG
ncbi:MAG: transcriptional repressor [Burkholderiaceae bacterium]